MAADWHDSLKALLGDQPVENEQPTAAEEPAAEVERARLDIVTERKGRGGKVATIITGFTISDDAVADIAARLRRQLGTGGSARGGEILIQGDRSADVARALTAMGLKNRRI
ncbi:MAG: hypothetical protein ACI4AM_02420 [Muribaculaceae bacterium]